ncbi:efflux RND transporter periplasmic adaptor subunit [Candidatus Kaiserbacteria bacterium]|nr:efflux RND transporter periplasmic adaptor subunit [Candidatus Kaiserbacteria bacterium]
MKNQLFRVVAYARTHTILSSVAVILMLGGGYMAYAKVHASSQPVRYILGTVKKATVISTVTGSGQVSASNQVDIQPRAGGQIISLAAAEGQYVAAGAAIAYIDSTDAQKAVRDAQTSLDSANIALQKLRQPADALSVTQAQNSIAKAQESQQSAEDSLATAYDDGFTDVANTFTDMPTVVTGLKNIVFGYESGLGGSSQWNIAFYADKIDKLRNDTSGDALSADVQAKYNAAKTAYDAAFTLYKSTDRTASPAALETMITKTTDSVTKTSDALKAMNNIIRVYEDLLVNTNPPAVAATHLANINTYTTTTNTHISSLQSSLQTVKDSKQAISDSKRTIEEDQAQLDKLKAGTDPLDVQSSQLTVTQRENALTDARNTLANYTVRAPFAGTIAKLSIHKGDTVSSGTAAATIVTKQQIAELALNEVDAAKVAVGQKATLTFDAIDGLSITGEIASMDTIGTVTQGVVTYTVKIAFDTQDARVKPGMTANATIQTAVRQDVLTVPTSAIKSQNGQSYVLIFNPPVAESLIQSAGSQGVEMKSAPENVPVTVGITDDTSAEILSGLAEGEQVVLRSQTGQSATSAAAAGKTTPAARGGIGGIRGL